jgi:predicted transcriptional regulator
MTPHRAGVGKTANASPEPRNRPSVSRDVGRQGSHAVRWRTCHRGSAAGARACRNARRDPSRNPCRHATIATGTGTALSPIRGSPGSRAQATSSPQPFQIFPESIDFPEMGPNKERPVGSSSRHGRNRKGMVDRSSGWRVLEPPPDYTGYAICARTGEDNAMADEQQPTSGNRELTTQIVTAYIRKNPIGADALPAMISAVHEALGRLGTPPEDPVVERTPAVPIRRSVHRDYVVCLECGHRGQMVRRHLAAAHGLTVEEYRARWNLSADHAMIAPVYSERRSTMAKQLGLGGRRGRSAQTAAVLELETARQPAPKRRGRPKSAATPA